MATSISGTNLTFPSGGSITGGGELRSIRWSHPGNITTAVYMNSQSEYYMNCEVTMPPAVGADSIYLIWGQCVFDDTNSSTNGAGLCIWVEQDGSSEWIHRQGDHSTYDSIGGDRYRFCTTTELDLPNDPTTGGGNYGSSYNVSAGKVRKYRLYAHGHNSNMIGCCGVGGQDKSRAQIIVAELSGGFIVPGYGN